MNTFISKEYTIPLDSIKFDTVLSTFNRVQDEEEFLKTKLSIEAVGQQDPIVMDNSLCIDGRHRVKALELLGIDTVKCIDINPKLPIEEKLLVCNKDITSGRHLTKAQLAIQAYEYAVLTGVDKKDSAKKFGVRTQELSYISNIETFRPSAYKDLKTKGYTVIEDRKTKSLEAVNRYINAEKAKGELEVETVGLDIDYNSAILTEKGKELFWSLYTENLRPNVILADHLVRYVNLRFKSQ